MSMGWADPDMLSLRGDRVELLPCSLGGFTGDTGGESAAADRFPPWRALPPCADERRTEPTAFSSSVGAELSGVP